MSYDHWKTTNPDDAYLGSAPEDDREPEDEMNTPAPLPKQTSAVPAQPNTLAAVIVERIRAGATLEETREFYKFLREIQADEARRSFARDFVALRLPEIAKLGKIDIGRGKPQQYARWEDINEAIMPVLHAHGFKLRFDIKDGEDKLECTAILLHRDGHEISNTKTLPLDKSGSKNIVQAYGSTQSYAQRYAAIALLNLTARGEDDDGRAAAGNNGNGHLTAAQIEELQEAIVDAGADIGRFCTVYSIERVEDLPARKLAEAKAKLAKFKRDREAKR